MNETRKSDEPIVPKKPPNNAGSPAAEAVEGRGSPKANTEEANTSRTQRRTGASSGLDRVRQVARHDKAVRFTALLHHITLESLTATYRRMNRQGAPGVDGVTWHEYGQDLEGNLKDLLDRVHRGAYRAKPSKRVWIAKADGRQRPLGIASLEDKLLQGAVVEVLNAIYETDFLDFSYGFRPERKAHDALDALAVAITKRKVNWVLDADIRSFFDSIPINRLVEALEYRVADRRILRLIQKWLNAGVLEDDTWKASDVGTPQGATLSPLLANVYLHYVLDMWAHRWRTTVGRGETYIVRYADDFVVCFQYTADADRFLAELRKQLADYGLELHPEKTRLIEFGRFAASNRSKRGRGNPETFDFLGFTHTCAKSRAGWFQLRRQTIRKRLRAKLQELKIEIRKRMHVNIHDTGMWLGTVLRGYYGYFGVPLNIAALSAFRREVERMLYHMLRRRSQRSNVTWAYVRAISQTYLPRASITHPWPDKRFAARSRGRSPVR